MKNIVVTGGRGFIGAHVVDALVSRGDRVRVLDVQAFVRSVGGCNPHAEYHNADIRDITALMPILAKACAVVHLAALPRVQFSIRHPMETFDVNVRGTAVLLEAARQAGVERFVFASSSSVYGAATPIPLSETLVPKPMSPYAAQKRMAEILCETYARTYGMKTVSLRYFNVYGPGIDPEGPYALVMGVFLKQWREGRALTVTGTGEQTRDFTHTSDVVSATLKAIDSPHVTRGEVVNVGAGKPVSVNRLAGLFGGPIEYIAPRDEPMHTCADRRLAYQLLGWVPAVCIEDGVAELKKNST